MYTSNPYTSNIDATVSTSLENPVLEKVNLKLGTIITTKNSSFEETTFNGTTNIYGNNSSNIIPITGVFPSEYTSNIFHNDCIFNGTTNIYGDVTLISVNFSGTTLGQIRNKYSSTNDSIVLNYNPVSLTNSLHNIIIGTNSFSFNSTLLGLTSSTLIGHSILESNNVVNSELICVGNNILKVNTQVCTTSVNMGNNILQNYVGLIDNQVMIGNEIFSELKENTILTNCLVGNNVCSTCITLNSKSFQQNTFLGNNILKNNSFSNLSNSIQNNVCVGNDVLNSNNVSSLNIRDNTIVGADSLSNDSIVNLSFNTSFGSNICNNNFNLGTLEHSTFIGNHILQNSTISSIQHSTFIGTNASSSNDTSILYRSAIGSNALVSSNYNTIIGHISTVSLPAIKVGINTSSCVGLLHVRESNYSESSNRILYTENKTSREIMSVSCTGMYLKGQFMSEYYENNSIVFSKTVLPESKIGENNVIIGDMIMTLVASGIGNVKDTIIIGTKILSRLNSIGANVYDSNILIGNEILPLTVLITNEKFENNIFIGNKLLETTKFINENDQVKNNMIIGRNINVDTIVLNIFKNNIVLGENALTPTTAINIPEIFDSFAIGNESFSNNSNLTGITNSFAIGNSAGENCINVSRVNNCIFVGNNSKASNTSLNICENRIAIGVNSIVIQNDSMVIGQESSLSVPSTQVGIGTSSPNALMHVKQNINSGNNDLMRVETSNGKQLFGVGITGPKIYDVEGEQYATIKYSNTYSSEVTQNYQLMESNNGTNIAKMIVSETSTPFIYINFGGPGPVNDNFWINREVNMPATRTGAIVFFNNSVSDLSPVTLGGIITVNTLAKTETNRVMLFPSGIMTFTYGLIPVDPPAPNKFAFRLGSARKEDGVNRLPRNYTIYYLILD